MNRRITVCTICHNRVLNCLLRAGVDVHRVRPLGRTVSVEVPRAQVAAACACLDNICMQYTVERLGLAAVAAFLRRRPFLWITAALLSLVLIAALQVVWTVRIECPDDLYDAVHAAVATRYVAPRFRRSVDTEDIRAAVNRLEGVALVSVYTRGVYLYVEVKEELPKGEIVLSNGPIVAACDCVISRLVVERGRAMVQVGQSVRKGDVLIAPEYLLDAEADITAPTRAVGTVYGYTYPSATALYDEQTVHTLRTGAVKRTAQLVVAGHTLGDIAPCDYANYEIETQTITLSGLLPVQIERTIYYETATVTQFEPFEVAKEGIIEQCYAQIYAQLKKDVEILDKWCIIDNMGSVHRVRAYAKAEQIVGVYGNEE